MLAGSLKIEIYPKYIMTYNVSISNEMLSYIRQHLDLSNEADIISRVSHVSHEGSIIIDGTTVIKIFNTTRLEEFDLQKLHEISVKLADLISDYVPKIYHIHTIENELVIFMEKIDGQTLFQYMNSHDNHHGDECLDIVTSLVKAVNAMHTTGYIHGDMHCHNILLTPELTIKLIDFSNSDYIDAVDPGDGTTPKWVNDYIQLSDIIAKLIFSNKHPDILGMSIADTLKTVQNFTKDDVIGDIETATKLYTFLDCLRSIWGNFEQ